MINRVTPQLILASASPRRQQLLQQLGLTFSVVPQDIDESKRADEAPLDYVQRMAFEKSAAAAQSAPDSAVVLGADTIVVCDEMVLGKPVGEADALRMLTLLSDREHQVYTAVCLHSGLRFESALSESTVSFRAIGAAEATAYWQSGEPKGKAGAYGIQGLAGQFVKRLNGSYSGVMGLPLYETASLLRQFGIACLLTASE